MSVTQEGVELRLESHNRIETPSPLPLFDDPGDSGKGEPIVLKSCDEAQPRQMLGSVPTGPALHPRRREQAPLLIEANGRGGNPRLPGERIDSEFVCHHSSLAVCEHLVCDYLLAYKT